MVLDGPVRTKGAGSTLKTRTVGIYLFDEVEVLDFAGPFEVFCTASRVQARLEPAAPRPLDVLTLADRPRTVRQMEFEWTAAE
jgi:hypothetical protein